MTREDAVSLVHGLVAIPSLSRREAAAAAWLADRMRASGYARTAVDEAGNAVGELGDPDAPIVIVLLGHIDTVPGDIPVRIETAVPGAGAAPPDATQAVLYGRGSVDAKGPLAAFAAAGARLGHEWARRHGIRLVVVGAVEEEAATSKGARFIASRFDGRREPVPTFCVIGEPSSWRRVTLGYKGRLLVDLMARQPMAHTAGPDTAVAELVVHLWNRVRAHADDANAGREKVFEQVSPSLRRFVTANTDGLTDTVDAQFAWRLPVGFDAPAFARELIAWAGIVVEAPGLPEAGLATGEDGGEPVRIEGPRTTFALRFRGYEEAWRGDRTNPLVASFLAAIRAVDAAAQPGVVLKTGTSDMNVVAPVWRCPIVAYGPGDSALDHTPNEHLSLDEYWRAVTVLEQALVNLAAKLART